MNVRMPKTVKTKKQTKQQQTLARLPGVDELLHEPVLLDLEEELGRPPVLLAARDLLAELRERYRQDDGGDGWNETVERLPELVAGRARELVRPSLQTVINATGVVLHTNLGRAPLSKAAAEAVAALATGYTNLEFDLKSGKRGERHAHARKLLGLVLGCEDAVVVNNCAAAVFLALTALAEGGEVIVSRGELVEIGGSFRIPDIMGRSGAILAEVGATNKTRIGDYEKAINDRTRLLLKVHRSNFEITGFTEMPEREELVALAKRNGLHVFEDLGSGLLDDGDGYGLPDEPTPQLCLREGVDLVSFSGDKLLGGPQAGILAGRREMVERCRTHPLFRALRVDKMTYAALEATLRAYLQGHYMEVPVLEMLNRSAKSIGARADALKAKLEKGIGDAATLSVIDGESVVGGGTAPGTTLPTRLLAVAPKNISANELARRLRRATPPVIVRVEDDTVLLDLRTVFDGQEASLLSALQIALA